MKNLKSLLAGFVLAAGLAFAPVTVFAAEDTENVLPAMEVVEETAEVANEEVVFSIPTATVVEETTTETAEAVEEAVEATAETTDEVVDNANAESTDIIDSVENTVSDDDAIIASDNETPALAPAAEVTNENTEDTTSDEELVAGDTTPAPAADNAAEVVDNANAESTDTTDDANAESDNASEEANDTTVDNTVALVASVDATAADAANAESTDDAASDETITGRQVGTANNGYAEMSDGSDAFCVEQEKDHVEDGVEYTREDDVDGSQFNDIFVARQEALDTQELSKEDINKITQLAIWAVLSGESYEDLVNFYYHEAGVDLYNKMFQAHEGDWTFKYWSYTPSSDMFQKLISGQASKVVTPDEPEVPEVPTEPDEPVIPDQPDEPETPDVPEVPDVPEQPEIPNVPETPETPDVPSEPEQPSQPEVPTTSQEPVVLSETFEAPVQSVPVLSARMASTDDATNSTARMAVIFAMAAVVALLVKKENA